MSHTYAVMDLSPEAYAEVRGKMLQAGYAHAIDVNHGHEVIDLHGIGIMAASQPEARPWSDHDDRFLIFHGWCLESSFGAGEGYKFVGEHDLGCDPGEAEARIVWLRAHKPELVAEVEGFAAKAEL